MVANVSSGADLAMRYHLRGNCRDVNDNEIFDKSIYCKHLKHEAIELQWPFSNKLFFLVNDRRVPSIPFLSFIRPHIEMKLTLTDPVNNQIMQ